MVDEAAAAMAARNVIKASPMTTRNGVNIAVENPVMAPVNAVDVAVVPAAVPAQMLMGATFSRSRASAKI